MLVNAGNPLTPSFSPTGGEGVSAYIAGANIPPFLSILRSGTDVILSWPSTGTSGFGLEQTPTVAAEATWTTNTAGVNDNGTTRSVTLPATDNHQFFRLRKP